MDCRNRRVGRQIVLSLLLSLAVVSAFTANVPAGDAAKGTDAEKPSAFTPVEGSVPVILDGEVLFYVAKPEGAFTPEERARKLEGDLLRMAEDPFYKEDLLTVEEGATFSSVIYRGRVVGVVTEEAAARFGMTHQEGTALLVEKVKGAVAKYRERRLPEAWIRSVVTLVIATILLAGLLFALSRIRRRLSASVEAWADRWRASQEPVRFRILRNQWADSGTRILKWAHWGLGIGLCVVYLGVAFHLLPITRAYAYSVLHYVLEPVQNLWNAFVGKIGDLFFILVVVLLCYGTLRGLKWLLSQAALGTLSLPGVEREWAMALYKIVRIAVVAVGAVMIYPYIPGSSSAAFKGISIFAGALFTIGASGAASNFVGGITLVFMGAFRIGDRVRVGDVTGDVLSSNLLHTKIRTPKNEIVTVPNSTVLSSHLVNYSSEARRGKLILHTSLTIGYDVPWRTVHELLVKAALETRDILDDPTPFVLQTALNDYSVTYQINAYIENAGAMAGILGELHQNIQDAFAEAGVEILSPLYAATRDGNASTVPKSGGM